MSRNLHVRLSLASLCAAGALLGPAGNAQACGGLFCSAATPVNQAAERIIFAQDDNGTTTAVIEIQYQGPADRFAWVLPVPGVPDVGLSSKQALDRLQGQTNPQYQVNTIFDDACEFPSFAGSDGDFGGQDAGASDGDNSVQVLASGSVGPYDFNVIQVDADAAEPAALMIDWLAMNDYDVSLLGEDLLGEYVAQGMNFLAVRLNKTASAGSVRPLMIRYQSERPVIPIRPTAVAANPDMGVMTWVLGNSRAIPANYFGLELNDALINWFNPGPGYNEVVIRAANEAGGHGFVTEYAADASTLNETIWRSFETDWRNELDDLEVMALMELSASYFGSWDGYSDVVRETVPLREGVTVEDFLECVTCYFYPGGIQFDGDGGILAPDGGAAEGDSIYSLDAAGFLASLDELVVDPMRKTQALFDSADYATRLYTTLSPDEMTVDPEFDYNRDLPDVSNIHQVDQVLQCNDGGESWTIELPSGAIVYGADRNTWPITFADNLPYNLRIMQYSTSGPGEVIVDNSGMIITGVDALPKPPTSGGNGGNMNGPTLGSGQQADGGPSTGSDVESAGSGCGCSLPGNTGASKGAGFLGLSLLTALALRRRRLS